MELKEDGCSSCQSAYAWLGTQLLGENTSHSLFKISAAKQKLFMVLEGSQGEN